MRIMFVNKDILTDKLLEYLNHKIPSSELVAWAEDMIREADFDKADSQLLRGILGRVGLADVKEFGLSWEDCYEFLHQLGHTATVTVS